MTAGYERGLIEIADGVWAWLQPDGSWGWNNAGLIGGDGASLLVDTLFDLRLTQEMLDGMGGITGTRPIQTLVNTHANGDHCFGNQLVEAEIVATEACFDEFGMDSPEMLAQLTTADLGDPVVNRFVREAFGAFDFSGIVATPPTRTFVDQLELAVGGRRIDLIEVGPAHTNGDLIAYVPDAKTVFSGDILFIYGTPIVWAGPIDNWIRACDRILALDVETIVPGHGPITDREGPKMVSDYLRFVQKEAGERQDAGMSASDAARDIELGEFGEWTDSERLAVNVHAVYRDNDPDYAAPPLAQLVVEMAYLVDRT